MPDNIRECNNLIRSLQTKTYFPYALPAYNERLNEILEELRLNGIEDVEKEGYKRILSYLTVIMREAKPLVDERINQRFEAREITDKDQARKTAAGNVFQQFVAYTLSKNVVLGNINRDVVVTTSTRSILENYAAIRVGDDIQKPDSDVLIYSPDDATSPIINFSCKTSCRERAGQTYKWKLLCDIATCECEHKTNNEQCPANIYNLDYHPQRSIKMCFVTSDFYDEIEQPQIAGMFRFFDQAFVAKPNRNNGFIKSFEKVIDYINSIY